MFVQRVRWAAWYEAPLLTCKLRKRKTYVKIKAAHAFEFAKRKIQNYTLFCTLSLSIHQLFLNISEYIVKRLHTKYDFMSICITDCIVCCMQKKVIVFIINQWLWGHFVKQKTKKKHWEWKENWRWWYIRALRVLSLFWYGVGKLDAGEGATQGSDKHTNTQIEPDMQTWTAPPHGKVQEMESSEAKRGSLFLSNKHKRCRNANIIQMLSQCRHFFMAA